MRILYASDLHLKPASSYRKTLLAGDSFHALAQIERIALQEPVDAVIFGGDVTDCNQPAEEVRARLKSFGEAMNGGCIKWLYIEGNHDRVLRNPYLPTDFYEGHKIMDTAGAVSLSDCGRSIGNKVFRGIDYCPSTQLLERLKDVQECDVLVLHAGFRHMLGYEDAYDLTMADIPPQVREAVLVGHVHIQSNAKTTPAGGNEITVYSSGSTWPWRIDEVNKRHGCYIFDTDDMSKGRFVDLDCRKWFDIDEESDILETVKEVAKGEHTLTPVLRYKREDLPGLDCAKYPEVKLIAISGDVEVEEALDATEEYAGNLQEALPIGVPPDDYPVQFAFMKALLDSQDPKAYVLEHLKEMGIALKEDK